MDSIEMDQNGDCSNEMADEQLGCLDPAYACAVFGLVDLPSRVGDQYQVEIPPLITESEYLAYLRNPIEEQNRKCNFLMGLLIPITWINREVENIKGEKQDLFCELNDSKLKNEPFDVALDNEKMKNDNSKDKMRSCLVPGCCVDSWSDIEKASFLLGLYIFGKDFVQVKRFIESKKMGDILLFYYGTFYRSDEYPRWSEGKKNKSRRCVYGQRIFSGLRQQELLSRLVPRVSEECQNDLLEVSRTFADGRISLEEYVSSLKAMVGMENLVEAMGIGKGKLDLTGTSIEPSKSNQVIHIRPEIPIGKACSSLTPREIIKFLTGDYRLSKARSNDLFWEAVWPRLLARGWHSEQPSNYNYAANSKHALVFLMPKIKKFSRRRLVKGDHYFDSVTDVLNKVASDPELLELEIEENEGNGEITKLEEDDLPERRRHCYLQPRTPSRSTEVMKFTVVDTSLAGGTTFEVRELKALPLEISGKLTSTSHSDEELVSTEESDCAYTISPDQETNNGKSDREKRFPEKKDVKVGSLDNGENSKNHNVVYEGKQQKGFKANLSRRPKQDNLGHFAPVGKRRRRLTACSHVETNHQGMSNLTHPSLEREMNGPSLEREVNGCFSDTTRDLSENILSQVSSSQANKLSSTRSSSRGSSMESIEKEQPYEVPQPRTFDLNFPKVPLDFGSSDFMIDSAEGQDGQRKTNMDEPGVAQKASVDMGNSEEQSNVNSRRQSTRNRPPTARALEAFANGFLTINSRRKDNARANSRSRKSQHSRGEVGITEFVTGDVSMPKEDENVQCNGVDSNIVFGENFQVFPNENGTTKVSGL